MPAISSTEPSSAVTSEEVRQSIQTSPLGVRALARLHGISPTTVAKWKRRNSISDARRGRQRTSSSLTAGEERLIDTVRRYALLPLDDCLYALQLAIPQLTRSTLHRCFQRYGIGGLPAIAVPCQKDNLIGVFFVGIDKVRLRDGVRHLCFAVDPVSRLIYFDLVERNDASDLSGFLHGLARTVPYALSAVVTAGDQPAFTDLLDRKRVIHAEVDRTHPWANGLAVKGGRLSASADDSPPLIQRTSQELSGHVRSFAAQYVESRRLKVLGGLTPRQNLERLQHRAPALFHRGASTPSWD